MKKNKETLSFPPPTTTYDGTTHTHTVGEIRAHIYSQSSHSILFLFPRVFLSRCSPTLARVLIIRFCFFFFYLFFSDFITQSLRIYVFADFSQHHCSSIITSAPLLRLTYPRPYTLYSAQIYPSYTVNSYVIIIIIIAHIILLYMRGETAERSRKTTTRPRSYITYYIYISYTHRRIILYVLAHGCSRPRGPVITPPLPVHSSRAPWSVYKM